MYELFWKAARFPASGGYVECVFERDLKLSVSNRKNKGTQLWLDNKGWKNGSPISDHSVDEKIFSLIKKKAEEFGNTVRSTDSVDCIILSKHIFNQSAITDEDFAFTATFFKAKEKETFC